jgi:hypothetical protein
MPTCLDAKSTEVPDVKSTAGSKQWWTRSLQWVEESDGLKRSDGRVDDCFALIALIRHVCPLHLPPPDAVDSASAIRSRILRVGLSVAHAPVSASRKPPQSLPRVMAPG